MYGLSIANPGEKCQAQMFLSCRGGSGVDAGWGRLRRPGGNRFSFPYPRWRGDACVAQPLLDLSLPFVSINPYWHGPALKLYDKVQLTCHSELHYHWHEKRSTSLHVDAIGPEDHRRF